MRIHPAVVTWTVAAWGLAAAPARASFVEVVRHDSARGEIVFMAGDLVTPGIPITVPDFDGLVRTGGPSTPRLSTGAEPYGPLFADVNVWDPSADSIGARPGVAGKGSPGGAPAALSGSGSSLQPGAPLVGSGLVMTGMLEGAAGLALDGTLEGTIGVTATVTLQGVAPSPTPVPLPAAGWLFTGGLIGLAALRRACSRWASASCHM